MKPKQQRRLLHPLLLLSALAGVASNTHAIDLFWSGGTGSYTNAAGWGGTVPGANDHALNNSGLGNILQINAGNPDWTVNDLTAGGSAEGVSGAIQQNGQTVTVNSWLHIGAGANATGVYTLNDGTLNIRSGRLFLGEAPGTIATLNINGGVLNKAGDIFTIADGGWNGSGARTGTVNQVAGTINSSSEIWIGQTAPGVGIYNLHGGTINSTNWFVVGRNGSSGTMNMDGGSVLQTSGGQPAFIVGDNAEGTLNHSAGIIRTTAGEFWIGNGGNAIGTNNMSGTAVLNVNNWIAVGRGGIGVLNLSGGSLTKTGNGNIVVPGSGTGIINQTGGAFTNLGSQVWLPENGSGTWNMDGGTAIMNVVHICRNGGSIGVLNLNGGLFRAHEITTGNLGGFSTINFNGGTLQAGSDTGNFLHDLTTASVQPGGAVIDSQGFNVTIAQSLGDAGGGLTKMGSGTVVLTGANSYSGVTAVNAGRLITTTASAASGDYTVANGAVLGITVLSGNAQLNAANVTLGTSTGSTLEFDLGAFGNPTAAPLNVAGALTVNGVTTINIKDALPQLGAFPLITYGSRAGSGSFVLGSLPVGVTAAIVTNSGTSSIELNVTSINVPRWDGQAGGVWDIGVTTNWVNVGTGTPTTYGEGNFVLFDDAALGTTTVTLNTTVNPGGITANNNGLNYTLTGSGKVSGAGGLAKEGSGAFTIANTGGNNYTGPTVVSGGTLAVNSLANGGSPSSIGASSANPTNLVLAGGTLSYAGPAASVNRGYSVQATNSTIDVQANLTLSGTITAGVEGTFFKTGPAQLAYTATSSNLLSGVNSGGYFVQDGTVVFGGTAGNQTNIIAGQRLAINGSTSTASVVVANSTLTTVGNVDLANFDNALAAMSVNSNATLNVGSWLILGDGANATATLTLNNGTVNANNGTLLMGGRPGTITTLNLNGGTFNKSGGTIVIGPGDWNGEGVRTGIVNQVAGTITSSDEFQIGQANLGLGIYNLNGGTIVARNWFVTGRAGATGLFTMTGGTIVKTNGGNFIIGSGAGNNGLASVGVFNHSGGTIFCDNEYWLAENDLVVATNNISGTAAVNVNNWVSLGRRGYGVVNFSGGTFNKTGGGQFILAEGTGTCEWNQTGGALNIASELWIGQSGSSTGTFNLVNGTVTNNSWLAVGREGGIGTLNISGGSMTKNGGGNISITHGTGASGTVNQSGGVFTLTSGITWIGEDNGAGVWNMTGGTANLLVVHLAETSSATGTLNLNGGTFAATEITTGNGSTGTSALNLNGGTLVAAGGANLEFLHGLSAANVLAGGAIINSGTNIINVAQPLLDGAGGGGLAKLGTGTLNLNGVNTYTGATLVNAGALGGTGTIAGPVNVASGAALAPGASIGTLTINNTLTLANDSATVVEVSLDGGVTNNDVVTGLTTVNYGGSLVVSNAGAAPLVAGSKFKLFNAAASAGNFSSVTILPAGSGTFNPATGEVTITAAGSIAVGSTRLVGGNLILTGTGGVPGSGYTWLTATNIATPLASWVTNSTGVFDSNGSFSNAIPVNASEPARFFRLRQP